MKKLIFAALAAMLALQATAQPRPATQPRSAAAPARTGAVSGQIVDGESNRAMAGAYVELKSTADTTIVRSTSSQPDGKFSVGNMPFGDYTVRVSFMGYEEYHSRVTLNMRNLTVAAFYMNQSSLQIDGAVVSAPMIRVSMHGDTIVYNPKAFKTAEDADAEAVIKQLPGAEVQDGTVKIQGKMVSKILVDNKETYGTDVAETMKTIPANMLEKIEVYDKLSDFAETTGINDGDDYTVMNFVTGIKFAVFGDASAMYGHKDMYAAGARLNLVTGGHRFGVNGGANNTGAAAAFGDMQTPGMFGGGGYGARYGSRGGSSSSGNKIRNTSTGATYNYEKNENFRINANYSYRYARSGTRSESQTQYLTSQQYSHQNSWSEGDTRNNGHGFGLSSRWKINNKNNVNARLMGTISDGKGASSNEQQYFDRALAELVQKFASGSTSTSDSYNIRLQVNYGLKLSDKGRNLSVGVMVGSERSNSNSDMRADIWRRNAAPQDSTALTRSTSRQRSTGVNAQMRYYEPLNRYTHLSARYSFHYDPNDGDRRSELWKADPALWEAWGAGSNVMLREEFNHQYGLGLNYKKNNNQLRFDVAHDIDVLSGRSTLPREWSDRRVYQNPSISGEWRKQLTPQKSLNFDLSTRSNAPSLGQVQSFDEISTSGLSVTGGNPGLKPTFSYEGSVSYNTFQLGSSTSFALYMNGGITTRPVGTDKTEVTGDEGYTTPHGTWLAKGTDYYRPVNMKRQQWSLDGGMSWGRPLKFMKTNFNTNLGWGYSETPGLVNGQQNTGRSQTYSWSTQLNSNFSDNLIIGAGYDMGFSYTSNTNALYENYRSWSHSVNADFYWLFWKDVTVRANLDYTFMNSLSTTNYKYDRTMANFALGKKMLKKRGELFFTVNDIFNQRLSNTQNSYNDRIVFAQSYRLGRYYSLTFVYRLRNFSREDGAGFGRGGRGGHGSRGGGRRIPINL